MDQDSEHEDYDARPRRQIRPPARYEDYEVDFQDRSIWRYREDEEVPHLEDRARMTPLNSAYDFSRPSHMQRQNTNLPEMDRYYGKEQQPQEDLLVSLLTPERKMSPVHSTPLHAMQPRHPQEDIRSELEDIRHERHLLQETQRHLASELIDMRALRADMKQLVDAFQNFTSRSSPVCRPEIVQSPPLAAADGPEEDDWPTPPVWSSSVMDEMALADLPPPPPPGNSVQRAAAHPHVEEEDISTRLSPPVGSRTYRQPTAYSAAPLTRQWSTAHDHHHWSPPPESKYPVISGCKSEPGDGPQPPPARPRMQLPPSGLNPGSMVASNYYGPRPTIGNFTRRDPREFARLKLSLENLLPPDATERFKYQVLVDHLQLEEAQLIADAYLSSPTPFSDTMAALNDKFGQPHQIALRRISTVMDAPDVKRGDIAAFERFALVVQSLVGMLRTLGPEGEAELQCGSHVARLLSKLPPEQRAEFRRCMFYRGIQLHTLPDLAEWLKHEAWCQDTEGQLALREAKGKSAPKQDGRQSSRPVTVLHGREDASTKSETQALANATTVRGTKPFCPFCNNETHYLSKCTAVSKLTKDQLTEWIKTNRRCWRCARSHQAAQCNLKKTCNLCQGRHLQVLHEVNMRPAKVPATPIMGESHTTRATTEVLYLDRPTDGSRVLLKVVKVYLHYADRTLSTYAILDDGSERTMLLPEAAEKLGVQGTPEDIPLRTIRQEVQVLRGASVSFSISSPAKTKKRFKITAAFTSAQIGLASHNYPMQQLRKKYKHLIGLPLPNITDVTPLLLIGSDHPHLITPTEPVRLGPPGGPAAVCTRLGWTLQGPAGAVCHLAQPQQCLLTTLAPSAKELMRHVERLWQVDTIPFRSEKLVTRSKQDHEAITMLENKTTRVNVDGVLRYATPLLRQKTMPLLHSTKESVMPILRSVERRLAKDSVQAAAYKEEMEKLIRAGSVIKCSSEIPDDGGQEAWYIPHHMVRHNGKNRLVFNCSHQYQGHSLNDYLLPGPTLGASLLGVLLRFREHAVAISGDIKGMFHQVRLLPEDRALLRFVWRDFSQGEPPAVYEWQVLPFGTTCSPCCATFALQRHVYDNSQPEEDVRISIERNFYVDNCLQSIPTVAEGKQLVDKLRALLASAGFELRQWASNEPEVISHLPEESRSASVELWLAQHKTDAPESTLGLRWLFHTDVLGYKHRPVEYGIPTMRNIYKVLASQYDPLGFILPYTTRAKILVRHLWDKHRGWDDPLLPQGLLQKWKVWEEELQILPQVTLPRPYLPKDVDPCGLNQEMHVFCDSSEEAYGSVAYLRSTDKYGQVHLSFLMARSRVAPKRSHSMPRLELCAALTGAQLVQMLKRELTIDIKRIILWSDSTTVLTWLKSETCRFKVFVGTRVAEIQELTSGHVWRYVDSARNPADDVTRGKHLRELVEPNRWSQGPSFLLQSPDTWPEDPSLDQVPDTSELRKSVFCGVTTVTSCQHTLDLEQFSSWKDLLEATTQELHGAAGSDGPPAAEEYRQAEKVLLRRAQMESFPQEYSLLKRGRVVPRNSRLITLSPELDDDGDLIRVGGRLRRAEDLEPGTLHPVVLDPHHRVTKLLIQDFDNRLHHPGPERVFAELRRSFWVLRGREAVRRHQHSCFDCRRLRARPVVPRMADLPVARLRLFKPAFYSTGMDCFGPFEIKVGRRREKRWGIIFKCLTTRAVHLDLLTAMDTDSFLMALRRFSARRGTPAELLSDQGTNFKGGEKELQKAFAEISPALQEHLAPQKIAFRFNPPASPHFGGVWEREIRSVKVALSATVGAQPVAEEVLHTVLIEVENILNSKPLGYVSSDARDPDPVTPNVLLMGRPDGSLPQVVYPETELLSRRRWKHTQVLADHFWARFIKLYVPSFQTRQKWQATSTDLTQDSVVMIADPQLPRALWPIGTVTKTHPSPDGRIRSADVKVKGRVYTRPVARLVVLPMLPTENEEDNATAAVPP
ncbi:uncharacterized protein LOC144006560 [Festucalex cinctus]